MSGSSADARRASGRRPTSKPGGHACSVRLAPTGRPVSGPIPDRSRIAGVWIAPALRTMLAASISSPPAVATPTARPPSIATRSTSVSPRTSRLGRPRAGSR